MRWWTWTDISSEPWNSSGCNCLEVVRVLGCIIKDIESRKKREDEDEVGKPKEKKATCWNF